MRIDKFLAANGCGTRKMVKQLLDKGEITVNGVVVTSPKYQLLEEDLPKVACKGQALKGKLHTIFALYKPVGVLSAAKDKSLPCALDYLPKEYKSRDFSCVGRLDKHSEGLLLLSNDGQLIHRLTQPKWQIEKEYYVHFTPSITTEQAVEVAEAFAQGIDLQEFVCLPALFTYVTPNEAKVCIKEGKFHQVRRMFQHCGMEVTRLIRIREGHFSLGTLTSGDIRELSLEECAVIYQEVDLQHT